MNDLAEGRAIARLFGPASRVTSTKGVTGHLLGAAGALSAAVSLDALHRGRLPGTVGMRNKDPAVPIRLLAEPVRLEAKAVLSNTFAFGGSNASVLFGRRLRAGIAPPARDVHVHGAAFWAPGYSSLDAWLAGRRGDAADPPATLLGARARGRASFLSRMFAEVVAQVAADGRADLASVPMIFGSTYGEMSTTLALLETIATGEALLSPIRFQASVHNTAAGLLSIQLSNRSFTTALAAGRHTAAMGVLEAVTWLRVHGGAVILAIADESAPKPLWRSDAYPAMAGALLLGTEGGPRSLARLGSLRRETLDARSGRTLAFENNPSSGILSLLERVADRDHGPAALETRAGGWVVDVLPTSAP
jgi:hypothetical protein